MNTIKIKVFASILSFLISSNLHAQSWVNTLGKQASIEQEVSFIAHSFSEARTRTVKMPNGETLTSKSMGGAKTTEMSRWTTFAIKNSKGSTEIIAKPQRITEKDSRVEIDTDNPFATDRQAQASLDHYLYLMERVPKLKMNSDSLFSPKPIEQTVWTGPLLNPIHELSGVFLTNRFFDLEMGITWQDTIVGIYNSYINRYEVTELDKGKAKLKFTGFLRKVMPQSIPEDEVVDLPSIIQKGELEKIERDIFVKSAKYKGEMEVNVDNFLITEMILSEDKEQNSTLFGHVTPMTLEVEYKVKNKLK